MHKLETSKTKLSLEYDKLLQKYQVFLGLLYSSAVGFVGLYFTLPPSTVLTLAVSFGIILWTINQKTNRLEQELDKIKNSIVDIEIATLKSLKRKQ